MSLYNMLFGMNGQTDLLLAVIGLRKVDVERFRDVSAGDGGATIEVYTRTGGGNRDDYPNLLMRKRQEWIGSSDDDFDCTYCTDTFAVPEEWRADVAGLSDVLTNGLRREFAQHLAKTIRRDPTEADRLSAEYDREVEDLRGVPHLMANGHTFVPLSDGALLVALKIAEKNGGKLRSCWGIAPLALKVKRDEAVYPNHKDPNERRKIVRAEIGYDFAWRVDTAYWKHIQDEFSSDFPLTFGEIARGVEQRLKCAESAR